MRLLRYRVRSRSSRIGAGGPKLPHKRACSSNCAIQAQSSTSVLRPGTCLTWAALTSRQVKVSSSTYHTGFQYTPVLSMATWVTPWVFSHSRRATSSAAIVPKVRTCCSRVPLAPAPPTHAATVFLCTSSPQPRSIRVSMRHLLWSSHTARPEEPRHHEFARRAQGQQCGVPKVPTSNSRRTRGTNPYRRCPGVRRTSSLSHFHAAWVCRRHMTIQGELAKLGLRVSATAIRRLLGRQGLGPTHSQCG